MAGYVREVGVALLVGFIAGAVFLFGQLMYAQLVVMPRLITGGTDVLAVAVDVWWAVGFAAIAVVVYLVWQIWSARQRGA